MGFANKVVRGAIAIAALAIGSAALAGPVASDEEMSSTSLGALARGVDLTTFGAGDRAEPQSLIASEVLAPVVVERAAPGAKRPGSSSSRGQGDGRENGRPREWEREFEHGHGHEIDDHGAAVPVPPAAWLFASALGLLMLQRRRASKA